MWEVDKETKSKVYSNSHLSPQLTRQSPYPPPPTFSSHPRSPTPQTNPLPQLLALQRLPANTLCADCSAPSPQWASPKFGIFICLTCAGYHRGLGVHISFVRSITMDAFKSGEIQRMELGGNAAWKEFWSAKTREGGGDGVWRVPPSAEVLEERYGGEVGEEWKERLSCRVEGREFTGVQRAPQDKRKKKDGIEQSPARTASPAARTKKEANEAYFTRMGTENASRPEGLAPSQGGKYSGFGSAPPPSYPSSEDDKAMPGVDEFQRDPVAALTKGFGWFTSTVGKGAKNVNEGWVKPTAQKVSISLPFPLLFPGHTIGY